MKELPAIFQDGERTYFADTCEPLKAAAGGGELQLHAWGHALYPGVLLPRSYLPAVRSVGVWDAPVSQSWGLDLHCNEGIEFTYLKRGKTAFEVDGKQWTLRKGCLTITRPWQFHRVGAPHISAGAADLAHPRRWRAPPQPDLALARVAGLFGGRTAEADPPPQPQRAAGLAGRRRGRTLV